MVNAMNSSDQIQAYCSDLSLQAAEPLYGTASPAQAYLLLEYAGHWGEKALEESAIPELVKTRLNDLGKNIPGLKTLLIKTERRQRLAGGRAFTSPRYPCIRPDCTHSG